MACGIIVPRPGIKPAPPAFEVQSLNHWTAREVPRILTLYSLKNKGIILFKKKKLSQCKNFFFFMVGND